MGDAAGIASDPMAHPSDIRRLALLALYQLDARGGEADIDEVDASVLEVADLVDDIDGSRFVRDRVKYAASDREKAMALAVGAWGGRDAADADLVALAPDWPPHRQAAIDRAILRLAHHEITSERAPVGTAIDEAVELAKAFSTEKSPKFVNGVLGKLAELRGV